jgi:hypothetical protein
MTDKHETNHVWRKERTGQPVMMDKSDTTVNVTLPLCLCAICNICLTHWPIPHSDTTT